MSSRRGRLLSGGDDVTSQLAAVASQGRGEPRDPHHAEYAKSAATDHRADRAEHLGGEPRFELAQLGPPHEEHHVHAAHATPHLVRCVQVANDLTQGRADHVTRAG